MRIYRIQELRVHRNMSRKTLADLLNINESTIFRMEQKEKVSHIKTLIKIADALNCDLAYLLNESDIIRK